MSRIMVRFYVLSGIVVFELEGTRLRRYGEVPLGVMEYLDRRIASLNEGLRRISGLVAGPQPP